MEAPGKSSAVVQPTGVSEERLAQANGMLLPEEVQVTGIGSGAMASPEDWKAPTSGDDKRSLC